MVLRIETQASSMLAKSYSPSLCIYTPCVSGLMAKSILQMF
jgi:hypothetical protein